MKCALVTGVSGQDGAYLAKFLLQKNYKVVGVVRSYVSSSLKNLELLNIADEVEITQADLTDISSILKLFKTYTPSEVYNLSAQSSVSVSFQEPIGTIAYNMLSVLNLLESIKLFDSSIRLYQASSSDMFGNIDQLPITLETPFNPISPYAVSKASAYWAIVSYRKAYNLFALSGILFNHESVLRTKNFFLKKVVSESVDISLGLRDELFVGNIDVKRDFGYAPKYVEAMWLMLQQSTPKDYIVCSGISIKLRTIIEYVFETLQISKEKIVTDEKLYRPTEIYDIYGDNSRIKEELEWDYSIDFFSVVDEMISFERNCRKML